jgi:acetolactate synthase I/III small subunit
MTRHTLSVLVENKPGVLVRIAGLFSRRNFNIDSLAVGPTEHEEISRITIVVNCEERPLEQVTKQLNKLINVLKIVELEPGATVQRELILVKIRADAESRSRVLETVKLFRARVVDVAVDVVTIEATGNREKLDALIKVLEPFGIKELVQSGMVAIGRGGRSITDRALRPVERSAQAHDKKRKAHFKWQRFSTTTAPTSPSSSAGTSPCWDTAARDTRTRCPSAIPAWTCGSGCLRARPAGRRPPTTACAWSRPARPAKRPT